MKLTQKYPMLGSSANPQELAMSLKGLLVLLVPVLVQVLRMSGVEVLESDLIALIDAGVALVGSVMLVFGLCRKLYYKVRS